MRSSRNHGSPGGFSLIELLCVMAVIALLAALLLPSLTKARDRARQTQCAAQLKDIAIAFHGFAHDHNNQFPMQVPLSAGGSMGPSVRVGFTHSVSNEAYLHFRALAADLRTPRMVICPADTRLPAASFSVLSNQNLSYFASLNAEFGNANSLLAGDRNLTNDYAPPASVQRVGPNYLLRWSGELHRFRGNLLYSDGHVDQTADKGLRALYKTGGGAAYALNLPVVLTKPATIPTQSSAPASWSPGPVSSAPAKAPGGDAGAGLAAPESTAPAATAQVSTEKAPLPSTPVNPPPAPATEKPKTAEHPPGTNVVSETPHPEQPAPAEEPWFVGAIQFLKRFLWAFYLALLALALLLLLWRRHLTQEKRRKASLQEG
jgi:prepilin-type N-terminal cleavage/methylation domain-containing protein/prepilin-type processing-associated H-X9-DG protein